MAELPFFPLATDAYLADCDHLTDAEHGRYMLLLMAMWRAPGQRLPNDDAWLARKFRRSVDAVVAELRPLIAEFCQCDGNWITQKRLSREFATAAKSVKRRSDAAKTKWEKERERARLEAERRARENGEKDSVTIGGPTPTDSANPLKNNETQGYNADAPTPTPTPTLIREERERESAPGRASLIPPDWQPTAEDLAWAKTARPDLQPARLKLETEGFKNHAIGNNRTGHSWSHLWRGWIAKTKIGASNDGNRQKPASGSSKRAGDITAARIAALIGDGAERPIRPDGGQDDLELVGSASLADGPQDPE